MVRHRAGSGGRPRTVRGRTRPSRHTGRPRRPRCRSNAGRSGRSGRSGRARSDSRSGGHGCSAGSPRPRSIGHVGGQLAIYHRDLMSVRTSAGILLYRRRARRARRRRPRGAPGPPRRPVLREAGPRRLDDPEGRAGRGRRAAAGRRAPRVRGRDRDGARPGRDAPRAGLHHPEGWQGGPRLGRRGRPRPGHRPVERLRGRVAAALGASAAVRRDRPGRVVRRPTRPVAGSRPTQGPFMDRLETALRS